MNARLQSRLTRTAFWLAAATALVLAELPKPPSLPIDGFGDKFEHILAFAVLALLGAAAYPRYPLARLGERLSFFGALIEVLQALPMLNRDCDIMDWVADTVAVAVVLGVVAWFRARGRSRAASLAGEAA
ncbi:hypothetical protein ACFO0A_05795 [Novosphingobium tardum]|uniref:VanZ family protein n=1 Tax=Novosphingobium tardum TaxID=1538021 RepID=A0ABV8RML7_9SPHN